MSQSEPFFFEVVGHHEADRCDVVLAQPVAKLSQLRTIARLVGEDAVIDADLGRLWNCVVICTPEFSRFHRSQLAPARPATKSIFLGVPLS